MKKAQLLLITLFIFNLSFAQELSWKFKTEGMIHTTPLVSGQSAFVSGEDGFLYHLNAETGASVWKFKAGGALGSDPVLDQNTVFANSRDGFLYAVDAKSGRLKWKFKTLGEKIYDAWDYYLSSPVIGGQTLYFGSGDGFLYALEKNTGKLLWKFKTGDVVHASPVLFDGKVYIGSYDGFLYVINEKTGKMAWKFDTIGDAYFPKGEIQKAVVVADSIVYFGSRDYNIYAFDPRKGTGKWNMKERGSWVIATPEVKDKQIYFGTSDTHAFYALDAYNGEIKWRIPLNMRVYGSSAILNGKVYFGCFNGKLYTADQKTGEVLSTFQTEGSRKNYHLVYDANDKFRPDFEMYGNDYLKAEKKIMDMGAILSSVVISNNMIYFSSTDGYVYGLRL